MIVAYHYLDSFRPAGKNEPCSEGFYADTLISCWDIYVFVSFDCSIPLFGLILTGSKKWALFWRFHAETLIFYWDIYVFVSLDSSIPLFRFILTSSVKWALFWRFCAETLISCWDIYVFVSFDRSIPLFGLILIGSDKRTLFWRFHAETLISCWDIYVFVSLIIAYHYLDSFWLVQKNETCSEALAQKHWYPTEIFMFL